MFLFGTTVWRRWRQLCTQQVTSFLAAIPYEGKKPSLPVAQLPKGQVVEFALQDGQDCVNNIYSQVITIFEELT